MHSIDIFRQLAAQPRFKGWPMVGTPVFGPKIPYFGEVMTYSLQTGNGIEHYVSLLRHFGWSLCFGVTKDWQVITICQWKPGANKAGWELPPGGIGKIDPGASIAEIAERTQGVYLKETGFGKGTLTYLGNVLIETGKYRGAGPDDHGLAAHMFLATELEYVQKARQPNQNEIIETIRVPLDEFPAVLESGLFVEASAVPCAWQALMKLGMLRWSK